jgi:hypothetical protein|nr:MAG TPA: hypothetical protein [Herelleviridae sp.]
METSITRQEFNELLKSSEIEVFEADKVLGWLSEVLKSAGNLTLSEISAAKVEYDSLSQLTVVNDDLTKSFYYTRPTQVEERTFVETTVDGVNKSMTVKMYKDTPLNRFRGIVGIAVNDKQSLEKSVAEAVGVKKRYADGRVYQKTESGWKPVAENKKRPEKTKLNTAGRDQKKTLKERIISAVKRMSDGQIKVFLKNKDISGLRRSELEKEARKRGIMN